MPACLDSPERVMLSFVKCIELHRYKVLYKGPKWGLPRE